MDRDDKASKSTSIHGKMSFGTSSMSQSFSSFNLISSEYFDQEATHASKWSFMKSGNCGSLCFFDDDEKLLDNLSHVNLWRRPRVFGDEVRVSLRCHISIRVYCTIVQLGKGNCSLSIQRSRSSPSNCCGEGGSYGSQQHVPFNDNQLQSLSTYLVSRHDTFLLKYQSVMNSGRLHLLHSCLTSVETRKDVICTTRRRA